MIIRKININKINDKIINMVFEKLNDYDKTRLLKMPEIRKKHFIAGRYLLLKNNININDICYNINKKPLINTSYFSISHSYDYTVVVINDKPIGVDIEKIRNIDELIKKKFCDNINIGDGDFIKLFTRKEAYIKLKGLALKNYNDCISDYKFITKKFNNYYITICI